MNLPLGSHCQPRLEVGAIVSWRSWALKEIREVSDLLMAGILNILLSAFKLAFLISLGRACFELQIHE